MNLSDALIDPESSAWARFLGTHLPQRTLDLRLDLVTPHRRGSKPECAPASLRAILEEARTNPRALFGTVAEHARSHNRWKMPAGQRFALAETLSPPLVSVARDQVSEIIKGAVGVPEDRGHREILDAIGAALEALLVSYQQTFKSDYDKGRFWYVRARDRVHYTAHRIMNLIGLLQQARALRYQTLDGGHWRIANTIYRVMLDYEQVEIELPVLPPLIGTPRGRERRSLSELYANMHLPWAADFLCWPESLMPFVLDYCRGVVDAIRVLPADGSHRGEHFAYTACYRAAPPRLRRRTPSQEGPSVLIDFGILAEEVSNDFSELRKARGERNPYLLPRRFARIEPAHQLAAGLRMLRQLARGPQSDAHHGHAGAGRDLRIHAGFQEVFAHLQAVFSPHGLAAPNRELSNLFAQRSAAIGEDDTATQESLWRVVSEEGHWLRLQTQETRFTNRLGIGSFLAYGEGETGIAAPRLGQVTRIQRPDNGLLLIDVAPFADYARPAGIRRTEVAAEEPVRSLLCYSDQSGWSLLLPDDERFWEQTPVTLLAGNKEMRLQIAELLDMGENYCLFRLRAKLGGAGRPRYPVELEKSSENPDTANSQGSHEAR